MLDINTQLEIHTSDQDMNDQPFEHAVADETVYVTRRHSAVRTQNFIFNQLIPYIGNKRKLLDLIAKAISHTGGIDHNAVFLDLFSGSGVVARLAKSLGYKVIANDWEPYSQVINNCYIARNQVPRFTHLGGYDAALNTLNNLPPRIDWVTEHLCPRSDDNYDIEVDRMFFMRKNGMRIDAIRHQVLKWATDGDINSAEQDCLLAPLVYQTCYASNTSGVFKGFHNGWGGKTGTALYRIAGDLKLTPAVYHENHKENEVLRMDAQSVAEVFANREITIAYLDPPYNQHPYGSNYHVLNSVVLWDKPPLTRAISGRTKSAIRMDWRTERRSAYNHSSDASIAYRRLIHSLNARYILTSYSTDGTIPLENLLASNLERGDITIEMKGYKRYRVSSQRFSDKPMNVEFIVIVDTHKKPSKSLDELKHSILDAEESVINEHPESNSLEQFQMKLF